MSLSPLAPELQFAAFAEQLREPNASLISPDRYAAALHLDMAELAAHAHVHRNTLAARPQSPKVQAHLRESLRVLRAAFDVAAGDQARAVYWYRNHPIGDFGYKTAEQLVADGDTDAVLGYLESLAGGASG